MEERALKLPNQLQAPAEAPSPFSEDGESDEGEFEFPFVSRDSPAGTAAPADELFADGRIRPFYPVFGRVGAAPAAPQRVRGQLGRLFLEESRAHNSSIGSTASSSSSAATDDDGSLEGAPQESYCLWTPPGPGSSSPSPRPPRKSSSTGSMARWRRISELVVGRSHSDAKEKFVFFPVAPHHPPPKEAVGSNYKHRDKPKAKPGPATGVARKEVDTVAHRAAAYGGAPRRTFLPYREELVGFFANVNGVSRSHQHPF